VIVATPVLVSARSTSARYGRREVFRDVSFDVRRGQSLGVLGPNGAGKTTLLRMLTGALTPVTGDVRIGGYRPRDAVTRMNVAYFAGATTLPSSVRAAAWGTLGNGEAVIPDRRRIRALSQGMKQLLGLRTVLSRQALQLIVLDEPWEGLDTESSRWLNATLESKRDRGAAVVVSSHRLHDLAGFCDEYLFLLPHEARLVKAIEIARVGPVTAPLLAATFDRLRERSTAADEVAGLTATAVLDSGPDA
jgi:ABC-2 type transport system ATP-binding protein